jgi:transposase
MEWAVERGLQRRQAEPVPALGIDEKAFRKGHHYFTLVNDRERSRVLYVAEDRTQASLDGFWPTLSEEQRKSIQAVAMDRWDPYVNATRLKLPEADGKIVFDKFHIAKHLGEAVDKVRRKENKTLRAAGDDTLAGTRYDWLRHPARMEPEDRKAFAALRDSGLKTARAWALKETRMAFFEYR